MQNIVLKQQRWNKYISPSLSVLVAIFPGEPGLAGFIRAKDDGSDGDHWSCKTCKAPVKSVQSSSQIVTTNKPTPNFLQAGCPSCHPTNTLRVLKGKRITFHVLVHPSSSGWGLPALSLTTKGSWTPVPHGNEYTNITIGRLCYLKSLVCTILQSGLSCCK